MARVLEWWRDFWLAPADPRPLALCRILFFASMFGLNATYDFSGWPEIDPVFFHDAVFPFSQLPGEYPVPSAGVLVVLQLLWKISFVTACIGLFTRTSIWASFLLSFLLISMEDSHSMKLHHWNLVMVFIPGILCFARCADAWSVDRWLRTRRGESSEYVLSGEYRWPMEMVPFFVAAFFFQAGFSKLRVDGMELLTSRNMQNVFLQHYVVFIPGGNFVAGPDAPLFPGYLNFWVGQSAFLSKLTLLGAIVLEVAFPLAVFSRWGRILIAPPGFLMVMTFSVFIGPPHYTFLATGLFWLPWDKLLPRLVPRPRVPWPESWTKAA